MCSHKNITWNDINNTVTDRMIHNSLIHKFSLSRNLQKRTKIVNDEIKKNCGTKDYKQYVELKTNVLRNLVEDIDTDDPGFLTDVDYDIIYSSPSNQAKYVIENTEKYIFTSEEDCKGCKKKNNTTAKKKKKKNTNKNITRVQNKNIKNIKNTKSTVKKKKPLQAKYNTISSKKCINTGWQDIIKRNRDTLHLSDNRIHANILENEEKDNDSDYLDTQFNNQSLSLFDSPNNTTSNIIKSEDENIDHQNYGDINTVVSKSNPEDTTCNIENNTICNIENNTICDIENSTVHNIKNNAICNIETQPVSENKNYEDQNKAINQSNKELGLQSPYYQVSPSKPPILDNTNNFDNELNSVIKLKESNNNKLTEINKTLINTKNNNNTHINNEFNLLENVRRNLMPMLEETNSTDNDKGIKQDKSVENRLNYDQSLLSIANSNQHSTLLLKTQASVSKMQNLSPDNSSLDQQKDSGFDEDSQDKDERSNIKNSTNLDIASKIAVSQQLKNTAEIKDAVALEDSKDIEEDIKHTHLKLYDDILEKQGKDKEKEISEKGEMEDSSRLNQDNKDVEICLINKEDKIHLMEQKLCNIQDSKEEKPSEEEVKNFLQLSQIDENTEILINQEEKTHFVKSEDSYSIQNQRLLSSKEDYTEDAHSKSCNNILEEQDDKTIKENKEEKDFLHSAQLHKDIEIYSINHEDKTPVESEETYNIQKQQLLPKVTCTEVINKKYKIINKKINDINSNIEKSDNININTSIIHKDTLIKNNQDVISYNIDNWQEEVVNMEEIDNMPMALETDNEEENLNYMSPQTRKRLQQQARLNLVVSDSSENDEECITIKTSRKHVDSSDTNHCSEDSDFKNDEINYVSKKINTDISCNKDMCIHSKETTPVPVKEIVKLNSTNMRKEIKKKADEMISLAKRTYENVNSFKSIIDKKTHYENVYNSDDNQSEYMEDIESLRLESSISNASYNNKESVNQISKDKQSSLLDKENVCHKNNQCEDSTRDDCTSEHETSCNEQSMQISTNCPNVRVDTSWRYRPCNLHELVEDQELFAETISPSFTLADLSEDDEAFILNIPSKVLQYNLQGELMILKEKMIKFGENKYRIVRRKVDTTTCIFATGKNRKPYKTVNIKEVSTITIRERLSQRSKESNIIPSKSKSKSVKINNRQTKETSSKMLKVLSHNKCKGRRSSDIEIKQPATKKRRLNVIHS